MSWSSCWKYCSGLSGFFRFSLRYVLSSSAFSLTISSTGLSLCLIPVVKFFSRSLKGIRYLSASPISSMVSSASLTCGLPPRKIISRSCVKLTQKTHILSHQMTFIQIINKLKHLTRIKLHLTTIIHITELLFVIINPAAYPQKPPRKNHSLTPQKLALSSTRKHAEGKKMKHQALKTNIPPRFRP